MRATTLVVLAMLVGSGFSQPWSSNPVQQQCFFATARPADSNVRPGADVAVAKVSICTTEHGE